MALVVKDRVRETSTTTGTGTFTLAGAVAGFQSFTAIGTGNTTYYTIVMSGDWEVGLGTWTSPDQLSRDTVLASSNAGALVPFGSGTKDVFCTFPAEGFASPPAIGSTTPNAITGTTITAQTNAIIGDGANPSGIYGSLSVEDWSGIGLDYYLTLKSTDGTYNYPIVISDGAYVFNGFDVYNDFTSYGTSWLQSDVTVGATGTSTALIQLYNIGGNTIGLTVPTTISTNYTLTLPSTSGSANQILKTDGTGVTSWTTIDPLTLTGISDPSAPSGTNTTVYSKSFGGYPTLAGRNALNTSFGLQSALWSKNIQMWTNTTGINGSWMNTGGVGNGNYTRANPTIGSTTYQSCGRSVYANVITTTNQVLGVQNNQPNFFRGSVAGQGGFFFYARVGFDTWTNGGRLFVGMGLSTAVVSADPSASLHIVGFCIEAADNGAISFITRAGSGAATKASTGLTAVTNKGYDCYIYCSPNSTQYTWQIIDINTGTSVTGTATNTLPVNTQPQYCFALASNAALTTADAIKLGVAKIYVESDY